MAEGRLTVDRHVFASPAAAYDTAWVTYGWSPALEGARASRLEEEVPWGSLIARSEDPARLWGSVDAVLDVTNRDRLQSAFLPLDGRLGFSVWGAVGAQRVGSDWRVLTHTLLLDAEVFRRLAGHPEGLLHLEGRASPWLERLARSDFTEPGPLPAVEIEGSETLTRSFGRARRAELRRLRDHLLNGVGPEALGASLGAIYEALARCLQGESTRYVVVRGTGVHSARLLRFVWLSLPVEDRVRVFFQTEQRKTERPRAHLLGLASEEWGRYVPDGAWIVGEHEPHEVTPGRGHWAALVTDPDAWDDFVELDRRAGLQQWGLVARDDLTPVARRVEWKGAWLRQGPTLEGALDLYTVEAEGVARPRLRVVGRMLAEAVMAMGTATEPRPDLEPVEAVLARIPPHHRVGVLRGAVRMLGARGPAGRRLAGLLRCRAARTGDPVLGRELHRFVDRESEALRTLLASPDDAWTLVEGALPAALRDDAVAKELLAMGAADAAWSSVRAEDLAEALAGRGPEVAGLVADLLLTLVRERPGDDASAMAAEALLSLVDEGALAGLARELAAHLETGRDGPAAEALRREILLRAGEGTGTASDPPLARLLAAGPTAARPREHVEEWAAFLRDASSAWLGREAVLSRLMDVFHVAGQPFGGVRDGLGPLAVTLAARLLERVGPSALPDDRAEAVLRLLWASGSEAPLDVLARKRREALVPVLAQLLVAPAPQPLFGGIRKRLAEALDGGAPVRGAEPWIEGLRAYAPGVAERLGSARESIRSDARSTLFVSAGG